jgi:hypothetical protein
MIIKEITEEIYLDKAQNGARILFEFDSYRLLDGVKDETESYFLFDLNKEKRYEIDLKTCYDLFARYHCGYRPYLLDILDHISEEGEGEYEFHN